MDMCEACVAQLGARSAIVIRVPSTVGMKIHRGVYPNPLRTLRFRPSARTMHGRSSIPHGAISRSRYCHVVARNGRKEQQLCIRLAFIEEEPARCDQGKGLGAVPPPAPGRARLAAATFVAFASAATIILAPGDSLAASSDVAALPLPQQQLHSPKGGGLPSPSPSSLPSSSTLSPAPAVIASLPGSLHHQGQKSGDPAVLGAAAPPLPAVLAPIPGSQPGGGSQAAQRQALDLPPIPTSFPPLPEIQAPDFVEVRWPEPVQELCVLVLCVMARN